MGRTATGDTVSPAGSPVPEPGSPLADVLLARIRVCLDRTAYEIDTNPFGRTAPKSAWRELGELAGVFVVSVVIVVGLFVVAGWRGR